MTREQALKAQKAWAAIGVTVTVEWILSYNKEVDG